MKQTWSRQLSWTCDFVKPQMSVYFVYFIAVLHILPSVCRGDAISPVRLSSPDPGLCLCPCAEADARLTADAATTLEDAVVNADKVSSELAVDKSTTSSKIRTKTSAEDDRPTARSLGAVGLVVIISVVSSVLLMDIGSFHRHFKNTWPRVEKSVIELSNPATSVAGFNSSNKTKSGVVSEINRSDTDVSMLESEGVRTPVHNNDVSKAEMIELCSGVLLQVSGPSFETTNCSVPRPEYSGSDQRDSVTPRSSRFGRSNLESTSQFQLLEVQSLEAESTVNPTMDRFKADGIGETSA